MDHSNNKNTADEAQSQQQQPPERSNLFKAPEERPYRRRIKPPPAKVHHVHPSRFRRFVQSRTCCSLPQPNLPPPSATSPDDDDDTAAALTTSAVTATELGELQPPHAPPPDAAIGGSDDTAAAGAGTLDEATWKSVQEAYLAWCSSNDIPLSPGTMAELSIHSSQCIPPTTKARLG